MRSVLWMLLRWLVKLVRRGVVSDIVADVDESDGFEGEREMKVGRFYSHRLIRDGYW